MIRKNIFFTSDLHFGHDKCIEYCDRPYSDSSDMDEKLIKNWNSVVKSYDTVIVVGDFFMYHKKEKLKEILNRLNGFKVLVRGNHDMSSAEMQTIGFHHVCESMVIRIANENVNVSHYPYRNSKRDTRLYTFLHRLFPKKFFKPRRFEMQLDDDGRFLIHGHTHSKSVVKNKMIHVGVDAWDFKPIPLQKIANIIGQIKTGNYNENNR